MLTPVIKVHPDVAALSRAAAERIVAAAEESIAVAGRFTIALAGGSTPRATYQLLASDEFATRIDWTKVQVFFGDERCVPPEHAESNYRMASESLLGKVPIPGDNVCRMRGEIEPEAAAKEYGQMLKEKFGDARDACDACDARDSPDDSGDAKDAEAGERAGGGIDLMLLGLGEDGHTASLFPRTPALRETKHRCVAQFVEHSTTGASWRLTLTPPFINRSAKILMLVSGAGKADALQRVLEGPRDPDTLPAQLIAPQHGQLTWLIDAAAAGMNE